MPKKIIILLSLILSSISILYASVSTNFELVESAMVAGGEKGVSVNFELSQGILGEVIGDSSTIEALTSPKPEGKGVTITTRGTIDDNGAALDLQVDEPQAEYQALIVDGAWKAEGVQLSEGERQIVVTGTDALGNPEIVTLQVTVDTLLPSRPTLNPVTSPTASSPQNLSGTKQAFTSIWLNGEEAVALDSNTAWEYDFFLVEEENSFTIFSKDQAQNASATITSSIFLDTIAPTVTITSHKDGDLAIESQINVSGEVDTDVARVEVNGVIATIVGNSFTATGIVLQEGWNVVSATATDDLGNSFKHNIDVFLDTTPPYKPTINTVTTPTNISPQTISGTKDPDSSLWLNGVEIIPINWDTEWSYDMPLVERDNPISLYVMDRAGRTSEVDNTQSIFLDTTLPDTPIVTDDGVYLVASNQLHASWFSGDPETNIAEYQYGIGTTKGARDVLDWTSTGLTPEVTNNTLGLAHQETYFFTVRALNFAGSWSEVGNSDGITLNKSIPEIVSIIPISGTKFKEGDTIRISVSAFDADYDSLEYRYLVNGIVVKDWNALDYYDWITSNYGRKKITIEVRDVFEADTVTSEDIFIYIEPVRP